MIELREAMQELLSAIENDDYTNAVCFLGDAIREARPRMPWDEADAIAYEIIMRTERKGI